ncbi:ketosteroid isomerase [Pseudomaricurvus alcaniphilus]|nr:ketosteroid isomerase [Pseudomaricurvus alcaniphilus]
MDTALQIAEKLSAEIQTLDVAGFNDLYAEDVIVWHSYDGVEETKSDNLASLAQLFSLVTKVYYDDIRFTETENGFVQQHNLCGQLKNGAVMPSIPVCMVARVSDGKITRLDEYVDISKFYALFT